VKIAWREYLEGELGERAWRQSFERVLGEYLKGVLEGSAWKSACVRQQNS
jgi:hypothetical protein